MAKVQGLTIKACKRHKLVLLFIMGIMLFSACPSDAAVSDPSDNWTDDDIIWLDADIRGDMLIIEVTERADISGWSFHFIEIYLNTDQNNSTGDARLGGLPGVEYRIECLTGFINDFVLHQLPANAVKVENGIIKTEKETSVPFYEIPGASGCVEGHTLTVTIPVSALGNTKAVDLFAVAHGGGNQYGIIGSGDRCPEFGALNTETGKQVVRRTSFPIDTTFSDPLGDNTSGSDLTSVRFRTFGDQFQTILTFAGSVDPLDWYSSMSSGQLIMDSDQSILTGFIPMGKEIASWGADVMLLYDISYNAPMVNLSYSKSNTSSLIPFGQPLNDGRWVTNGNQLIMTGSIGLFDAYQWTLYGEHIEVERQPTDGRMIAKAYTSNYGLTSDRMPNENGHVFDIQRGRVVEPLEWEPAITISETDPEEYGGISGMDLTGINVQVVENCLVVKGILSKLYSTQAGNLFEILLDTDMNTETGTSVFDNLSPEKTAIGADYSFRMYNYGPLDTFTPYYGELVGPDGVIGLHDAMFIVQPNDMGPGSFTLTIPFKAIGNPTSKLRLFVTTDSLDPLPGRTDFAPANPLVIDLDYEPALPQNNLPFAVLNGPYNGIEGEPENFSSAGTNDPDGTITDFLWDFGVGN